MFELIKDEKIITTKRRHKIILASQMAPFILLILFLVGFAFLNFLVDLSFLQQGVYSFFKVSLDTKSVHFLASFLAISFATFLWFIVLLEFIFFYFDSWTLTNKRIISTNVVNLFNKRIYTIPLKNIENIKTSRVGIMASFFDFGNLRVETAGNYENFTISHISDEQKFKREIFIAVEKATE